MTEQLVLLTATLITTIAGAFIGAFASSRFSYKHQAQAEQDKRRYALGERVLVPLLELRKMLRAVKHSRSKEGWAITANAAYDALDDARHLMPLSLSHLKRSVRSALGEAIGGVALSDQTPKLADSELEPYNYQWVTYADEYIEHAIDTIRRWRDAPPSTAESVTMLDFDKWLWATERYRPGGA
ncbi:hypothetical protein [Leifsonia sp. A12D58]|uniref:hypothetical protein n=1 Tax=Leifsonia sp. A12D58 TaxID=3397674 RepID=UPI0039E1A052